MKMKQNILNQSMTRRQFIRRTAFSSAGIAGAVAFGGPLPNEFGRAATGGEKKRRKPNVIFIITDDQKLGSFGFLGKKALTPNIDRLANSGVYFSRAYVSTSVCTPSRYTCLTGRYAGRAVNPEFKNATSAEGQTRIGWNTHLVKEALNLPKVLQQNGYVTGAVGKWHLGGPKLKRIPIDSDPANSGIAKILKENQEKVCAHIRKQGFDYAASIHLTNLKNYPCRALGQHNIEWTVKGGLDFIEQNKDRPFFLYFATTLLHGPSPLESLKSDPRITTAGLLEKPLKVQPSRQSVLERVKKAGLPENAAPATCLDDAVGALMKKLDDMVLMEDTLIFYFNDHGVEGGKGSLYEGGVKTPTFIYWKDRIKSRKCSELIQNTDFAPTILEACNITAPKKMVLDGKSFVPLLDGKKGKIHDSLFMEIGYTRAVCTKKWKYIAFRIPPSEHISREKRIALQQRYQRRKLEKDALEKSFEIDKDAPITHLGSVPGGSGTERGNALRHYAKNYFAPDQLYDLENDPEEQNNLADSPGYKNVLLEMKSLLKEHLKSVPGTFGEFKTSL
ncbi:MAG TPA: sulfatase [Phycisphaerales bacterium]|nr:sulfatase [Phycisphaerales bacterium]